MSSASATFPTILAQHTQLATVPHNDLKPLGQLNASAALGGALVICLLAAALLVALIVMLSKPRHTHRRPAQKGAHSSKTEKSVWHRRINEIVTQSDAGALTKDQAFTRLASLCREFASTVMNTDMRTSTLAELNRTPRTRGNSQGLDLLRQTISALYPAEFADANVNQPARETTVRQAGDWVSRLVERWR